MVESKAEGEEDAGEEQHDEAPERDLAQHERPVVGEDLAEVLLRQRGETEPFVGPVGRGPRAPRLLRCGR